MITAVIVFVGLGHSVLAMSGEESLAQVYREIEHPKLMNLKKAALVIFLYSMVFTSLVSFFAVMIIPDGIRPQFFENLIGGLAMSLQGPFVLRLAFHIFVVVVGTMILSGAVNTAIIGSNGVLNRVSEDGVLSDWFRHPHPKFGTSHRIINLIVMLQIVTIVISRGDVTFLANLYAFGVIWSFALKGIAVLVLRYTHPQEREFRVPLNFQIAGTEIPVGLALITLTLLGIAIVNLFTKPAATISGVTFSGLLFLAFELSEKRIQRKRGQTHVELDQFNLAQAAELTPEAVGVQAGQHPGAGEHLLRALSSGSRPAARETKGSGNRRAARPPAAARRVGRIRSRPRPAFQHHRAASLHKGSLHCRKGGQARPALGCGGQRFVGGHPAHRLESGIQRDRVGQFRQGAGRRAGPRNRHCLGTDAFAPPASESRNLHSLRPGTGLLPRPSRPQAYPEGNRSAPQDMAAVQRQDCPARKFITTTSCTSRSTKWSGNSRRARSPRCWNDCARICVKSATVA